MDVSHVSRQCSKAAGFQRPIRLNVHIFLHNADKTHRVTDLLQRELSSLGKIKGPIFGKNVLNQQQ